MTDSSRRGFFWLTIGVLFFVFLFLIRSILLPFVLGIFIAYFLDPAADRLEKTGVSRGAATAIIIASFFVVLSMLSIMIVPLLIGQFSGLVSSLPKYMTEFDRQLRPTFEHWLGGLPMVDMDSIKTTVTNISGVMVRVAGDFVAGLFQSGVAVVNILSLILITPVVAFYLLQDWDRIVARADVLLPRAHASVIREQLKIINQTLSGFLRGQLNVCLILSIYYIFLLSIFDLKFSTVIGLMTGFLVIVPYAGWFLGASIGVAVAFFQFDEINHVGAIASVFLVGMCLEGYYLTPKLVGKKVGLHPVWIIFGMLSGAALFGFVGVLLAVPVTAVAGVLLRFAMQHYLHSSYYQGESI